MGLILINFKGRFLVKKLMLLSIILLSSQVSYGMSDTDQALIAAETVGAAQEALEAGANVNAKDESGNTALHLAALDDNNLKLAQLLLDSGADVDAKNDRGVTALHTAAGKNDKELAKLLLDRGADVNAKHGSGDTALRLAVFDSADEDMVQLLLDSGAEINAENWIGETTLEQLKHFVKFSPSDKTRLDPIIRLLEAADPELDTDEKS